MLEAMIKRIIKRVYPELTGGLHMPLWGRVVSEPPAISQGDTSRASQPLYAVDVQLLNAKGEDDSAVPVFQKVPLPVNFAGAERGAFGFPPAGTLVEIGFIMGLPSKPFIRNVLIEGLTVPALAVDDLLIQKGAGCYQRAHANDDWERTTSADILENCVNYIQQIEQIKQSVAGQKHLIETGQTIWLGNASDNVLQLLSDFMSVVQQMASNIASHTHGGITPGMGMTQSPGNASAFSGAASDTGGLKSKLDPIVE